MEIATEINGHMTQSILIAHEQGQLAICSYMKPQARDTRVAAPKAALGRWLKQWTDLARSVRAGFKFAARRAKEMAL